MFLEELKLILWLIPAGEEEAQEEYRAAESELDAHCHPDAAQSHAARQQPCQRHSHCPYAAEVHNGGKGGLTHSYEHAICHYGSGKHRLCPGFDSHYFRS